MRGPTIVVGVDAVQDPTFAWAVGEAAAVGGRLVVCHVCPPGSLLATPRRSVPLAVVELADPALARALAAARGRLGGERVELTVHTGHVGAALVRAASKADLLAVGAPRRPGWAERASTTHHVVRHAPCPIVVVRPLTDIRRGPFAGHVVVGVDGSEPSRAALELGFSYADAHQLPVAAVHVTTQDHNDLWFDETTLETHVAVAPTGLALLGEEVEPWHQKHQRVPFKRALYGGRPLPGLLRAATGATLLVVGDRGRGPAVRALLGSVSHGAVDQAGCPVAVAHTVHGGHRPHL
jgi:nucleotide-binding universal stress UspA family protein